MQDVCVCLCVCVCVCVRACARVNDGMGRLCSDMCLDISVDEGMGGLSAAIYIGSRDPRMAGTVALEVMTAAGFVETQGSVPRKPKAVRATSEGTTESGLRQMGFCAGLPSKQRRCCRRRLVEHRTVGRTDVALRCGSKWGVLFDPMRFIGIIIHWNNYLLE